MPIIAKQNMTSIKKVRSSKPGNQSRKAIKRQTSLGLTNSVKILKVTSRRAIARKHIYLKIKRFKLHKTRINLTPYKKKKGVALAKPRTF